MLENSLHSRTSLCQTALYPEVSKLILHIALRGVARDGSGEGAQVNPIQSRGAYYAPRIFASPTGFKKLSTPLRNN